MKPIVSRSPAVGVILFGSAIAIACGSSQTQLTGEQQAAAQAEEHAQKAQADAQRARDDARKAQKDLAAAQQDSSEARKAEVAADEKAEQASHEAGMAEQRAGQAVHPPAPSPEAAQKPEKGVTEAQAAAASAPHAGHDSAGKVVVITASLLFPTGSAELLPSAKPKLDEIAEALKGQPQANDVKVQGHTDSTGTSAINDPLSQKRAQAVADYLESKGIAPERISAQGLGKSDPVSHSQSAEGRALNRRVDIVIEQVEAPAKTMEPAQPQP